MRQSLPWLASLTGAALLFTPTYGIGLVLAPLTLLGSWAALSPPSRVSPAAGAGAAFNLFVVVAGLAVLSAVWLLPSADRTSWPYLAIPWALVALLAPVLYTALRSVRKTRTQAHAR